MNNPKITIITPSYNQGIFLEEAILSVVQQSYPNVEYIIIDGGSTDNSIEIIKKYESNLAYWTSEPDGGQSNAINKGLVKASGDWIAWLNADDAYTDQAFWKIAQIVQEHKNTQWIVGTTLVTDENLKEIWRFYPHFNTGEWKSHHYKSLDSWVDIICSKKSGTALPQPSSFWSRRAVEQAGSLDESYQYAMDHEFYVRIARSGFHPFCIEEPLALYRTNEYSKTSQGKLNFWREELRVLEENLCHAEPNERVILLQYFKWLKHQVKILAIRDTCKKYPILSRIEALIPYSTESILSRLKHRMSKLTRTHE